MSCFTGQSNIGYLAADSADSHTMAGTWVSFNDKDSLSAIAKYVNDLGLGGAFVFDLSMDTIDYSSGAPTYELTKGLADALTGGGGTDDSAPAGDDSASSGNVCTADSTCNACDSCCQSYLSDQGACENRNATSPHLRRGRALWQR